MATTLSLAPKSIYDVLVAMPDRPPEVEVLLRKPKKIDDMIKAALARLGMCIYVMALRPMKATQGFRDGSVYYEQVEARVRVIETPALNKLDVEAAEMAARVQLALAGQNPGALFDDVLMPMETPFELSGVIDEQSGRLDVHYDVLMHAPMQLGTVETP